MIITEKIRLSIISCIVFILLNSHVNAEQMHIWTDEKGVTHMSNSSGPKNGSSANYKVKHYQSQPTISVDSLINTKIAHKTVPKKTNNLSWQEIIRKATIAGSESSISYRPSGRELYTHRIRYNPDCPKSRPECYDGLGAGEQGGGPPDPELLLRVRNRSQADRNIVATVYVVNDLNQPVIGCNFPPFLLKAKTMTKFLRCEYSFYNSNYNALDLKGFSISANLRSMVSPANINAPFDNEEIKKRRTGRGSYSYEYDVSGYGDDGYVYGGIDADGSKEVSGYLYKENGEEVYFTGEWVGKGEIEGYDENGEYYELEVD